MITWSFNQFIKEDRQRYIGRKEYDDNKEERKQVK
jgi:hypothetical protein